MSIVIKDVVIKFVDTNEKKKDAKFNEHNLLNSSWSNKKEDPIVRNIRMENKLKDR